ncbi:MAG: DUF58 domain-containing protein [Trueperaceae bacterium]
MTLVNDVLLGRLARRRLWSRWASPTSPDGERRGTLAGSGMEFADHREYHAGDDLRHLDAHAYARLGRPYVKLFAADRGLDIAVLVDASASMDYGSPAKLQVASELATAIAYVGIAAGDRVRLGAFGTDNALRWRPVVTSTNGVRTLVKGLDRPLPATGNEPDLRSVALASNAALTSTGLTIVLSDWWASSDPESTVRAFASTGRELVAIQVLAPEEEEPHLLTTGPTRLVDSELADSIDLSLDETTEAAYLRAFNSWRQRFQNSVEGVRGRVLTVRTDQVLANVVLDDWRKAGFIR